MKNVFLVSYDTHELMGRIDAQSIPNTGDIILISQDNLEYFYKVRQVVFEVSDWVLYPTTIYVSFID